MHWNGKAWSVYDIHDIAKFVPGVVGASAANNVWAFGLNELAVPKPYALIFNGGTWRSMPLPEGLMWGRRRC